MTQSLQEQLSALVDDELPAAEHALLLERLARDGGLRECLGRYQLMRDVLNNRVAMPVDGRFVDRVMHAIEAEPAYQARSGPWLRLAKPLAGVAVAASVALVAVLALQNVDPGTTGSSTPQVASAGLPATELVASGEVWERRPAPAGGRLNGYLVQHNEYAASSGVQGVLPYVRIVGYDSGNE
ncbi:MAG: sigma-E factor negative regulatory protein [Gammaproteobacteria bacterium]|nr:sigma-E factor negative regulatory protein [Gammaproteobacteria bacterium]MCW9058938.1 sigma-E factor negative regulatory protein [Gammaproteobacteria bacterium]